MSRLHRPAAAASALLVLFGLLAFQPLLAPILQAQAAVLWSPGVEGEIVSKAETLADLGADSAVAPAAVPVAATAASYFVDSVAGSDSNSGTSPERAWKSLSKVSAASFQPGDTVNFKRGGSWQGTLYVSSSGSATAPITFQPYGDGPSPEIHNTRAANSRAVVLKGDHLALKGFVLHDAREAGVEVPGSYDAVEGNDVYSTGWGVRLLGHDNRVLGNWIHDLEMIVNDSAPDNDYGAAGVVIWGGADRSEIAYNRIVRCRAPSHDYGHDGGVVEFWQTSEGHRIHHNYSSENNGAFEVGGGTVSNVSIYYNSFFNDYGGNTGIHWGGTYGAEVYDFKLENNTIVQPGDGGYLFSFWQGTPPDASRVIVRNNIIVTQETVYSDYRFTHGNNLYSLKQGGSLGDGVNLGSGEVVADPDFVDLSGGDLHLLEGSPAIDAGLDLDYALDFDGNSVPLGLATDIGSFEYGARADSHAHPGADEEAER